MRRQARGQLGGLAGAKREFERWRRSRERGTRIPGRLWTKAVDLARTHGVSQTSLALRLDYYALQRRLTAATGDEASPPAFVELALPAGAGQGRCQLELADRSGGQVRVEVRGLSAGELAAFVRGIVGWQEHRES